MSSGEEHRSVSSHVDRHQWSQPATRETVRRRLRHELAIQVADEGYLSGAASVGPFRETLTYTRGWTPGAEVVEVPAAAATSGDAVWDHVEVSVSVPVRTFE